MGYTEEILGEEGKNKIGEVWLKIHGSEVREQAPLHEQTNEKLGDFPWPVFTLNFDGRG